MFAVKPIRWAVVYVVLALSWMLATGRASADTFTWNNAAGDATWSATSGSLNWASSASSSAWINGNVAVFDIAGAGAVTVSGPVAPAALTFTASGYTLSGGTINLGGNLTSTNGTASGPTTINSTINLTANSLWTAKNGTALANGGTIVVGGAVNTGTNTLTINSSAGDSFIVIGSGGSLAGNVTVGNGGGGNSEAWLVNDAANQMSGAVVNLAAFSASGIANWYLNGNSETVSGLTSPSTVTTTNCQSFVTNNSSTPCTLTVNNSSNQTYNGGIQNSFTATGSAYSGSAALSLTVNGPATLTLNSGRAGFPTGAALSYTGSTTVNGGMLVFNASSANANNFGASAGYNIAGGTLQLLSTDATAFRWQNGAFSITGSGTFLRTGSADIFFSNGGSAATFNQAAGGLADFEGGTSDSFETATTNLSSLTINSATVKSLGDVYFDALNGNSGGIFVNSGAGTLYLGVNGGSGAFAGQIQNGSGQSLVKNGAGTQVLSGSNSYTGTTTVNNGALLLSGGSLSASSAVAVGGGAIFGGKGNAGAATVASGGTIQAGYNGTGALSLSALTFGGSGGISFGSLASYTSTPALSVTGLNGLSTTGTNSIIVSVGSISGTGAYELIGYSGTIQGNGSSAFQLAAPLPNRAVANLVDTGSQIDLNVSSFDFLVWTGAGNLVNGWNTATQNWKLNFAGSATTYLDNPADTVVFNDSAGANTTVAITAAAVHPTGVTFSNSTAAYVLNGPYGIAGNTSLIKNLGGSLTINNSNSFSGGMFVNGGSVAVNAPQGTSGGLTVSGGTVALNAAQGFGGGLTVSGGVVALNAAQNFTGGVTVSGGLVALNSAQNFTGGVTINNGTVQTGNAAALGANSVTFGPGTTSGMLQLAGTSTAIGGLTTNASSPGTAVVQNGSSAAAALTLNVVSGSPTFAGVIQDGPGGGALGLTKSGAGTQVLTGSNNTYSGPTLVNAGELDLTHGPSAGSGITVNNGAALGLKSAMTVAASATINGPGTATDAGALLNDVGTGNSTSYNGTITLGSNATIRNTSGTLNLGAINGTGGTAALTLVGVGLTNPVFLNGAITTAGTTAIKGTGNTNATLAAVYLGATNALPNMPLTINDTNLFLNGFDQQVGTTVGFNTFGVYNGSSGTYTPTFTVNMGGSCDLGFLASGHAGNDARFNLAVASTGTGSTYYNMHMWGNSNVYTGNTTVFSNAYLQMGQAGQSWDTPPANFVANCLTLNGGGILNQNGNNNGYLNEVVGATQGITLATSGGYIGAGGLPNTLVINSVISGSGALNVTTNLGTLVLAASNTYSGGTVIGATGPGYSAAATVANVQLGVANALPNGPGMGNLSLPLAGSSLDLNGFATTVNGVSGIGTVTNSNIINTTATFSVGANDAVSTFAGTIQSNIALNKVGSGTLTLTGALFYTGATTIAKGGVVLGAGVSLPATAVTLGGGAATVNGAVLDLGGNNQTVAGLAVSSAAPASQFITNNSATADSLLSFNGGSTPASFPGTITGGSNGHTIALSVSAGTLTLSGTNTYTGATTVNFGSLYVNGALNPAAAAPIAVYSTLGGRGRVGAVNINPSATLEAGQNGTGRLSVAGSLTFNANATVNIANVGAGSIAQYSGSAAIVVNGPLTANASFGGVVDLSLGTGGVNSGTYHLISYTGGLQLNGAQFADTFQVLQTPALISGRQTGSLMNDAGSIDYVVAGGSPVWSGLNGGTTPNSSWEVNPSLTNWNVTIGATTSPTDFRTTDSVTFDDTAGTGHTTVALNTADVSPVNVLFANQTLSYTLSGSHAITGATGVTKNNAGLAAIDNSNSFSGGLFVNGGTLQLNANNTFGGGATVSGGLLQINSANTFTGGVTISGGSVQLGDPGAMNAANPNAVAFGPDPAAGAKLQLKGNSVTIGGLSTDPVNPGSPVVENGDAADAVLTVNNTTLFGGATFAGVIQDGTGGGKLAFAKDGFYDVTLAGVNTYSGSTTVVNGTLHVGNNGAIPYGPGKGDVTVSGGGILDLAGFAANVNGLWDSGTIYNSTGNGTLIAGNNNATSTFSGTIEDAGGTVALTKTGSGALTLAGANGYSGPTTVAAGTLVLANALALPSGAGTSGVTVNSGTLDVDGQAVATSALFGGGTITSSTSGGVLTVSGTTASAFNGVIADGPAGATMGLAKDTFSVLTLGGSTANAYTGGTTLMNGVIKLQKSNGVPAIPGNILITGAPSWVGLPNQTSGIELYANEQTGGTATVVAFDDANFTGQADFRLRGYTTTIGGLQYTGNTTRAIVANGAAFDTGDSGNGTLKIDVAAGQAYSFNGLITDTTAGANDLNKLNLVMMGSGTQILGSLTSATTSSNSFSGSLTINGGTLVAAAAGNGANSALGAASSTRTIAVNAGGTLEFASPNVFGQFNATTAPTLAISGGTVTNADPAGSGAVNNALNNVALTNGVLTATTGQQGGYAAWNINGTITSSGNSLISTSDPVFGTVMLNSASGSSGTTTINISSGTLTISAPLVQDTVDGIVDALSMTGSGTLVLSGTNTYTGGTTVNGGTLIATNNEAIADGSSLTVGNASAFPAPMVPAAAIASVAAVTPVPEPGTLGLIAAAALAGIGIWRKKGRRA